MDDFTPTSSVGAPEAIYSTIDNVRWKFLDKFAYSVSSKNDHRHCPNKLCISNFIKKVGIALQLLTFLIYANFIFGQLPIARATLLVQVSTPFDPYRLECPRKFGVVKLIIQKIQSVGRLRDDLMVAAFCRNVTELYPSPFDRHSVEDDEDCRWTSTLELPGPNFTFRSVCSDREFLSGISRQDSIEYGFLCCRNRDKIKKKCFANQYAYPLSPDFPEVVIERKGLLVTSLAYQQKHLVVQFCDFGITNQEELDQESFVETRKKLAALEELQRQTTKRPLLIGSSVERRLKALAQERPSRERIVQVKTIIDPRISDLETRGRQQFAVAANDPLKQARIESSRSVERKIATIRRHSTSTKKPIPRIQIIPVKSSNDPNDDKIRYTLAPEIEEILSDIDNAEKVDNGFTDGPTDLSDDGGDSSSTKAKKRGDEGDEEEDDEETDGTTTENDEETDDDDVTTVTDSKTKTQFVHVSKETSKDSKSTSISTTNKKTATNNVQPRIPDAKFVATPAPPSFTPKIASRSKEKSLQGKSKEQPVKKKMKIIVKKVIRMSPTGPDLQSSTDKTVGKSLSVPTTNVDQTATKSNPPATNPGLFATKSSPNATKSTPKKARDLSATNADLFLKTLVDVQAKMKKRLSEEDEQTRNQFTSRVIRTPNDDVINNNKTVEEIEYLDDESGEQLSPNGIQWKTGAKYRRKPFKSKRKLIKIRKNVATKSEVIRKTTDQIDNDQIDSDHVDIDLATVNDNRTSALRNPEYYYYYYFYDGLNEKIEQRGKQAYCDKDKAATEETSGLVIACGQNQAIWTPLRCPDSTSCVKSLDSSFRICCPFRLHLFRV